MATKLSSQCKVITELLIVTRDFLLNEEFHAHDYSVTGHLVPRSFRTLVISYHFGHLVPTFIFSLVISYPVW